MGELEDKIGTVLVVLMCLSALVMVAYNVIIIITKVLLGAI